MNKQGVKYEQGQVKQKRTEITLVSLFSRATKAQVPGFIDTAESGKGVNRVLLGVQMRNMVHEEHYRQECDFTQFGKFINITEEPLPPSSRYEACTETKDTSRVGR